MTTGRAVLGFAAALLATLAAFVTAPEGGTVRVSITPLELASWIKERKPGLRVIDLRDSNDFDVFHLPSAESIPRDAQGVDLGLKGTNVVVIYDDDGAWMKNALPKPRWIRDSSTLVLRGGLDGWLDEVMNPILRTGATAEEKTAFEKAAELSRYFGGVPRRLDAMETAAFKRRKPSVLETRRRGC